MQPITVADHVELDRFMGDWYVIAHIPIFLERNAWDAVESYVAHEDGYIDTRFSFRAGGFDGEVKSYNMKGWVADDQSNAIWKVQFVWPFKSDYRVVHVDDDYQYTIVGREARDYVWIMARTPSLSDEVMEDLKRRVAQEGYDISRLRLVPQSDRSVPSGE